MNKPLILLYAVTFIGSFIEGFIAPIVPSNCEEYGITPIDIGVIMAASPFFTMITCPIVGALLDKCEYRYFLGSSIVAQAVSYAGFAAFPLLKSQTSIIAVLTVLRSVNGVAMGVYDTAFCAYGTQATEKPETFNSIWEACIAVGGALVPLVLYFSIDKFGDEVFLISIVLLPLSVVVTLITKQTQTQGNTEMQPAPSLDNNGDETRSTRGSSMVESKAADKSDDCDEEDDENNNVITYRKIMVDPLLAYGTATYLVHYSIYGALTTCLGLRLIDQYGMDERDVSLTFLVPFVPFLIGSLLTPYLLLEPEEDGGNSDRKTRLIIDKRALMTVFHILLASSMLGLAYASTVTGFMVALGCVGLGLAPLVVLPIPANFETGKLLFPDSPEEVVSNLTSGWMNGLASGGEAAAPLLGGLLYSLVGWSWLCVIAAACEMIVVLAYIVYVCWCKCREAKENDIDGPKEVEIQA